MIFFQTGLFQFVHFLSSKIISSLAFYYHLSLYKALYGKQRRFSKTQCDKYTYANTQANTYTHTRTTKMHKFILKLTNTHLHTYTHTCALKNVNLHLCYYHTTQVYIYKQSLSVRHRHECV